MITRGEEEEGLDPTMSLLSSPSSPSSLFSLDPEYEDAFKFICFPPSLPSPPLSPLWKLPDDYPENTILTKVKDKSLPQLPSSMPLNQLWKVSVFEDFPVHPESSHSFSKIEKGLITLLRGRPRDNDLINIFMRYKSSIYKSMTPVSEAEENMMIHLSSMMQKLSSSVIAKIIATKCCKSSVLQKDNGLIQVEPVKEVEQVPGLIQKDPFILIQQLKVLVKETCKHGVITKLHSQERQTVVELDEIEGDIGSDVLGITIRDKRNILSSTYTTSENAISLEDLRQCFSMTREDAAKSFDISVSTLKRVCRKHGISRWPFRKRGKKYEAPSKPKIMKTTEQETVPTRSSQTDLCAVNTVQDVHFVTIKATYLDSTIKFYLPCLSEMVKLEEEVAKRFKLEVGSFSIKYEDEDGDEILLTSSQDLRCCTDTWTSLGKTIIRMLVKLNNS